MDQKQDPITGRPPEKWERRVEIQIITVVMHAWSEVEHDLIYKNPWGLAPDLEIDRMLDAINGLSITSEILLRQLQETISTLSQRDERPFDDDPELDSALEEWLVKEASNAGPMARRSAYTGMLRTILVSPLFEATNRKTLRLFLHKHKERLLLHEQDRPLDLPRNLLCALGGSLKDRTRPWDGPMSDPPPGKYGIQRLHKYLLVADAISTMRILVEQDGTCYEEFLRPGQSPGESDIDGPMESILLPFHNGPYFFTLITEYILTGTTLEQLEHYTASDIRGIDDFVEAVLRHADEHPVSLYALSLALAYMSFFIKPTYSVGRSHVVRRATHPPSPLSDESHAMVYRMNFKFLDELLEECLREEWFRLSRHAEQTAHHFMGVNDHPGEPEPSLLRRIQEGEHYRSQLVILWPRHEYSPSPATRWTSLWLSTFKMWDDLRKISDVGDSFH